MNIFFAPHSDDEALFGSFIIQRTKPLIVVCTDGTSHEKKFGIPIDQRREESRQAAKILGVEVEFLGFTEEEFTKDLLKEKLTWGRPNHWGHVDLVFAPTRTGGNPHHDMVSDALGEMMSGAGRLFYGNYSKTNLAPSGEMAIIPTEEEVKKKEQALACYVSQIKINPHHFEAVKGVPEYLSFKQC